MQGNRIVIDCTASQECADYYSRWMASGIHVVSANKKGGAGSLELYDENKRLVSPPLPHSEPLPLPLPQPPAERVHPPAC